MIVRGVSCWLAGLIGLVSLGLRWTSDFFSKPPNSQGCWSFWWKEPRHDQRKAGLDWRKYLENDLAVLGSAAYGIIFLGVLAEYAGIPFPSSILLILAGALFYEGRLNGFAIFFLSFIAASLGDAVWFAIGRVRGQMFLDGYCKLSLGSENCVRRTQEFFRRFPKGSLLIGKFVPGLSAFVVPVAGFSGMGYRDFLRLDSGGIFLWVASLLTIGFWAGGSVDRLLANARSSGSVLVVFSAVFVTGFYAIKFWRLKRFGRAEIKEG